ncbi:pyrroline-5-carboxylate reductase [Bacillus salitolerans]|uniref:Pyrroline-5-carboxylate reductase n=1 Tax=Bacillus salitolerans TaxID=1437434 RepID=A0ABW4LUC5_9BACI
MEKKIAFLGAGSMAEALISGFIKNKIVKTSQIIASNRSNDNRLVELEKHYGIKTTKSKELLIQSADIVFLAMKPMDIGEGLQSIKPFVRKEHVLISLLAGVSSKTIQHILEQEIAVIRAMPNTSALIGQSSTAIARGEFACDMDVKRAKELFEAVGNVTEVCETQLHAVTGLSGSGPAYIYYMVESMQEAASVMGLDQAVARRLIVQTLVGAAEMLKQTNQDAITLRKHVTSKGGTTEAGIQTLEHFHYKDAIIQCIKEATKRSIEMEELYAVQRN